MNASKRVAVVGAGISGLVAIKSLKEEGLFPVCFEKTSRLGGLWHYHEDDTKGVPSVMWCTSLNNSKEPGALSDFPAKAESPNFMRHFQVLEMLQDYASKFDLLKHINYNKEVVKIIRADDYDATGKWCVSVKGVESEDIREDIYDGVLICAGHLSIENIPSFPCMDSFDGKIIHTHSLKKIIEFDDQVVCVVGTGSSALDAAVEISHVAKQASPVCLGCRRFDYSRSPGHQHTAITGTKAEPAFIRKHNRSPLRPPEIPSLLTLMLLNTVVWSQCNACFRAFGSKVSLK
ncbi:dimethylaniline monooxygenase 5 [Trichonephila clavipes]|uniref:Flavin-containing monooxygenase n=1 Tax=Trichonephila clavipes TaxID=2585209 RepID=A0A8X6UYK8_TRICX|nr:dimethylaniline monooxygenase 5 [Trichonephila clavipes]